MAVPVRHAEPIRRGVVWAGHRRKVEAMKAVFAGTTAAAALLHALVCAAQSPLTPVRPLASPDSASQWVEPPPGDKLAMPASAAAPSLPAAAAATAPPPAPQAPASETRTARRTTRNSGGSAANRLNHQELARIRSGVRAYSYPTSYPTYSFWPFRLF